MNSYCADCFSPFQWEPDTPCPDCGNTDQERRCSESDAALGRAEQKAGFRG